MTRGGSEIVVVDDDMSMSSAIGRLLSAAGLVAEAFPSAEDMLAACADRVIALLILDIHLPGLSGLELHRRLIAAGEVPPVIFITARDRPGLREQALGAGASAYFTKPFDGSELIHAIRSNLPPA